ncbi:MAG: hypothetical protein SFU84_06125 [Gemmatimonadales bacterium]|nr:hypothetical protein [Gemmatimonadales bacterium]
MAMVSPYRSLPVSKRVELVLLDLTTSKDSRALYIQRMVARGGGFRPVTLRSWPVEKLAKEIVRLNLETFQDELGMLQTLYVDKEPELQIAFLDAAGVAHKDGHIADDMPTPFASAELVASAAKLLLEQHGEDGKRYLRTIALYNGEAWPGLGSVIGEA